MSIAVNLFINQYSGLNSAEKKKKKKLKLEIQK